VHASHDASAVVTRQDKPVLVDGEKRRALGDEREGARVELGRRAARDTALLQPRRLIRRHDTG
jgi:hypothetical protein